MPKSGDSVIAFTCHKSSAMANSPSFLFLFLLLLLLLLLMLCTPCSKPPPGIEYVAGETDAEMMSPCFSDNVGSRLPDGGGPVAGVPG